MTHTEVVQTLAHRLGLSQRKAHDLLNSTVAALSNTLGNQTGVTVPGLGTFGTHIRRSHRAYSPFHKRLVILPAKRAVFFHPGAGLKANVRDMEVAE